MKQRAIEHGMEGITVIVTAGMIGLGFENSGLPLGLSVMLASAVSAGVLVLIYHIAAWVLQRWMKISVRPLFYASTLLAGLYELLEESTANLALWQKIVFCLMGTVLILLAGAVAGIALAAGSGRRKRVLAGIVSVVLLVPMGYGIACRGFQGTSDGFWSWPMNQASGENEVFASRLSEEGYTVATLTYGMDDTDMMRSDTVDVSNLVNGYEGIKKIVRDAYLGYSLEEVPLHGIIYYPLEAEACPVVFVVHGQHDMQTDSYLGYDYLGKFLAARGYVVVSVDENALNADNFEAINKENDARAILLLENMKMVEDFGCQEENQLYQKMNFDHVALVGHSRGGETAAIAALMNQYDYYPNNGMISLSYDFQIESVLAIAPTSDQYAPAGHSVELNDINYLVIQGANDADVTDYPGIQTYDSVTFSKDGESEDYFYKAALYIAGANHGQFNSLWGSFDQVQPFSLNLDVTALLQEDEQQQILTGYALAFLDSTLLGRTEEAEILKEQTQWGHLFPETIYVQRFSDSESACIADYEEDSDLEDMTEEDALASWSGFSSVREEKQYGSDSGTNENHVLHLEWKKGSGEAQYEVSFSSAKDLSDGISFSICDLRELSDYMEAERLTGSLIFEDEAGSRCEIALEEIGSIYPGIPVQTEKVQELFGEVEYQHVLETLRVTENLMNRSAEESATSEDRDFDWTRVRSVTFQFDRTGNGTVWIDDIERL